MKTIIVLLFLFVLSLISNVFGHHSIHSSLLGEKLNDNVEATSGLGQPWPRPQFMKSYNDDKFMIVRPARFHFQVEFTLHGIFCKKNG